MRQTVLILAALVALPAAALSQDDGGRFAIGTDRFLAGPTVSHADPETDDLFMAGETVTQTAPVTGSAHMAGRRVRIDGAIGGDLYAVGMDVTLAAPVAGDVTAAGYSVDLSGPVSGDVRVSGSDLRLGARIGGTALVAGDIVHIDGVVAGDMALAARNVRFGPEARIEGRLTLFEDTVGTLDIPDKVIAPDRIDRAQIRDWDHGAMPGGPVGWRGALWAYLGGVAVLSVLAALLAALLPGHLADLRARLLDGPLAMLGTGFVAVSACAGAGIVLGLTLIGLILTPAAIVIAIALAVIGYVVAVYALGVRLLIAAGRSVPDGLGPRIGAAILGSLLAGAIALVPLVGWVFALILGLAGAGAIISAALRPQLFAG